MTDYLRTRQILDDAVNGQTFMAHGPFWRSLTRDQFVAKSVFGMKLIITRDDGTFDPDESNLVKALEGRAPFGDNLDPPTPGAIWPRMPVGFPPVVEAKIQEIRDWISAGCPETDSSQPGWIDADAGGTLADATLHNAYFRDFDNWAMFQATAQTSEDIDRFFNAAFIYIKFAKDTTEEPAWVNALEETELVASIGRLEARQRETVIEHYGKPVPLLTLLDGYARFGDDSLPDDTQRPQDVRHNMNGRSMWFFWVGFADACLRLNSSAGIPQNFWQGMSRAILLGLINDGLFRERFPIVGFTADDAGRAAALQHVRSLEDGDISAELATRLRDSEIFAS